MKQHIKTVKCLSNLRFVSEINKNDLTLKILSVKFSTLTNKIISINAENV